MSPIHSDEGLTLETSVFESFTVANLPYRKENSVMQCNECTVHLLTFDIPEGFLVCSIMVVYSDFKSKVIIPQQQFQHSHFEINKHQYSSININMKDFDSGLNKGLHFVYNHPFNCFFNNDF